MGSFSAAIWASSLSKVCTLDALGGIEGETVGFLGEGEREGEGVAGVGVGFFGEVQHTLDHFGDGAVLGGAVSDDGLFHFARGDFEDVEAALGGGGEARAAGFAHDEGGLEILREEEAFDDAGGGLVLLDDCADGVVDFGEATGAFPGLRDADGSVGEGDVVGF